MIGLLKKDLPDHYGLSRSNISVPYETTSETLFDLTDGVKSSMVVEYGKGNVSFGRESVTLLEVINYEQYLNGFSGTAFERGRKRCDCIMYEKEENKKDFFLLNEQTSCLGTTDGLSKPISNKNKVLYTGGKYEKAEVQLSDTLRTLMDVPAIANFIRKYRRKICLMSYVVKPEMKPAQKAFSRSRQVEARETGEDGALLECKSINDFDFEYRRINHDYTFKLRLEKHETR